jgi:hypothetical protein
MVIQLGLHQVEIDSDIVITRLHGALTLEHMQAWCLIADGVIAEHGGMFSIGDYRGAGAIPPQVRRWVGEWSGSAKIRGMALFGASPVLRVIMMMIARAGVLLRKFKAPTVFVATEAEARAWVSELRARKR